ncbi:MAG: hypothetical protein ABII68_04200 [Pseudomonadota bacterium]
MDDKKSENHEKDPGYIPGIYNYCDRWCERCRFTARCRTYAMEEEEKDSGDAVDVFSDLFWEKITETLQSTMNLIEEIAREEGIDLDAVESGDSDDESDVVHILSGISEAYIDRVDGWFESNAPLIENGLRNHNNHPHLKLVHPEESEAPISLKDAVQVVRWYAHPIHVKLSRALRSKDSEKKLEFDDFSKDSDGSAKVALIGMDRSISAWGELLNYFKSRRKQILEIIRYLKRIRDIAEKEFPNARAFIRPGFDEVE